MATSPSFGIVHSHLHPPSPVINGSSDKQSKRVITTSLITITSNSTTAETAETTAETCTSPSSLPSPPVPATCPVRLLLDDWAEYFENGRRFYYNNHSQESSWKPPRRMTAMHVRKIEDGLDQDSTEPLDENQVIEPIVAFKPHPKPRRTVKGLENTETQVVAEETSPSNKTNAKSKGSPTQSNTNQKPTPPSSSTRPTLVRNTSSFMSFQRKNQVVPTKTCPTRSFNNNMTTTTSTASPVRRPRITPGCQPRNFIQINRSAVSRAATSPSSTSSNDNLQRYRNGNSRGDILDRTDSEASSTASSPVPTTLMKRPTAIPIPIPPPIQRTGLSKFNFKARSLAQLPTCSAMASSSSPPSTPLGLKDNPFKNGLVQENRNKVQRQLNATGFGIRYNSSRHHHPFNPFVTGNGTSNQSQEKKSEDNCEPSEPYVPPKHPTSLGQMKVSLRFHSIVSLIHSLTCIVLLIWLTRVGSSFIREFPYSLMMRRRNNESGIWLKMKQHVVIVSSILSLTAINVKMKMKRWRARFPCSFCRQN